MKRMHKGLGLLASAGVAVAATAAVAARDVDANAKSLPELKGATIYVGTKKAVAYYRADAGACNVTVAVSETFPEQIPYNLATVRFTGKIAAGNTAEVATSDGSAITLRCQVGAKALTIGGADEIAWIAPVSVN